MSPPRGQRPPFSGPIRTSATTTVQKPSEPKKFEKGGTSSKPLVDARQCLKCHGFGHNASECTTETLIVFTPDGKVIEVEEEKEPISGEDPSEELQESIWDEDPFEELQESIWDEYQCEELQFPVEEVSWSPTAIESSEVICEDVPCMIMPPEPLERRLQLLPYGIPQSQELFATSVQLYQTKNDVTREVLLQFHPHELSGDLFEIESIDMILPPDPLKSKVQLLIGHSSQTPMEYKYLPNTIIPTVDLIWVWVKSKKVSMSSAIKLGPMQMLLHSFVETPSRMMETPPPARENDRDGPVTVAVCYSNHRYCSKPLQ